LHSWLRRLDAQRPMRSMGGKLFTLLAHFVVDLLPPAVLLGAVWLVLPWAGLDGRARLAIIALAVAAAAIGLVIALTRAVFAPRYEELRLLPINGETANYLSIWVIR